MDELKQKAEESQKEKAIINRVIVMSSEESTDVEIDAYNLGASNFLTKPFDFKLLRSILRKNLGALDDATPDIIKTKFFVLDLKQLKCFKIENEKQIEITLTKIEFKILLNLAVNPGQVKLKEDLIFLGKDESDPMSFKALEMHVASMRKKLGADIIKTKRGVGYFLTTD